ncbi:MAG: signal peptidase I [Clostridia bacterium]|nr:signal peptidase I [Clostridia bacterium]
MTENNRFKENEETLETENLSLENTTAKKVLSILGKSTYYIIFGVVILFLIVNVYSILAAKVMKQQVPKVFGYAYQLVLTDSMKGTEPDSFPGHTLIVIKEQEKYEVGDIVTFSTGSEITTTHRIVGENDGMFITKGDFNNTEDIEPLDKKNIHGKVMWHSEYLGKILFNVRSPLGIIVLLFIGFLMLYIPNLFCNRKKIPAKH